MAGVGLAGGGGVSYGDWFGKEGLGAARLLQAEDTVEGSVAQLSLDHVSHVLQPRDRNSFPQVS